MANPGTISAETSLPAQGLQLARFAPWAGAAGVFLLALILYWPNKLDHDISYFLAVDEMLREGRRLYVDVIDFNTPAAFAPARLAAWINTATGLPLDLANKALAFALTAIGAALAFAVVRARLTGPARWIVAIGLPAALLFATPDIGGREQLFCAGFLPWALAVALGEKQPRWLSLAIGLTAGMALFLKPHFVAFAVVLGVIDLIRARGLPHRLLLSTWIAAAVSLALYGWFLLTQPAWLGEMLPFMLATYGQMKSGAVEMIAGLVRSGQFLAILAAAALGVMLVRSGSLPWRAVAVAAGFCLTALLLHIQQGYGFAYQLLPLKIGLALAMVFALAFAATTRLAMALSVVALALAMLWAPSPFAHQPKREAVAAHPLYRALQAPHAGDAILVISPGVDPTSEMLTFMDARWAGPIIPFIPIPALIEQGGRTGIAHPPAAPERAKWSAWFRHKMLAAFEANPPARVAVEITEQPLFFDNAGFDMLAWLREDPAFDSAWIKSGLARSGALVRWHDRTYQVWSRP